VISIFPTLIICDIFCSFYSVHKTINWFLKTTGLNFDYKIVILLISSGTSKSIDWINWSFQSNTNLCKNFAKKFTPSCFKPYILTIFSTRISKVDSDLEKDEQIFQKFKGKVERKSFREILIFLKWSLHRLTFLFINFVIKK